MATHCEITPPVDAFKTKPAESAVPNVIVNIVNIRDRQAAFS